MGKKRYLIGLFLALASLFGLYELWLFAEAEKVEWAISLVGGEQNLNSNILPEGLDKLYMESLYLHPSQESLERVAAVELCREKTEECVMKSLVLSNFLLINSNNRGAVDNILQYYQSDKGLQGGECPSAFETSYMISVTKSILALPEEQAKKIAEEKVRQIQLNGGLVYSLNSIECQQYFSRKPYMAQGYLAHLAMLMSVEKGKYSPRWVYLLAAPAVYSILN